MKEPVPWMQTRVEDRHTDFMPTGRLNAPETLASHGSSAIFALSPAAQLSPSLGRTRMDSLSIGRS